MKMRTGYVCLMALAMGFTGQLWAQGCVAVRPMGCSASGHSGQSSFLQKGQWQLTNGYRYFRSFRHFRGSEEEPNRVENGTEVVNIAHSVDFNLSRQLSDRWGLAFSIPIIYYDRSSLYEHYGNSPTANPDQLRFATGASGIGDIRITPNYWVFNPKTHTGRGNFSIGTGLKIPTGDENVTDDFHRLNSEGQDTTTNRAVDQSIQLGDGGWGLSLELQGYYGLSNRHSLNYSGFYLFNPRNTNNTLTRGTTEGVDPLIVNHSVADQFAARIGWNTVLMPRYGLLGGLGTQVEGVPSKDLIGDSDGFRRPGYIVSIEPNISMQVAQVTISVSVPIALYRNRTKSTYDLADPTGRRHGDAAFADYLVNINFGYRFSAGSFFGTPKT